MDKVYVPEGWRSTSGGGGRGKNEPGVAAALKRLRKEVGDCDRCRLSESRNRLVFGDGNPEAGIVLIGEGPGANEDRTGKPFVGRAGKLLDKILASIDLNRSKVYITNVVKCRPPRNRTPRRDEVTSCLWILEEQVRIMRPGIIIALGASAARTITGMDKGIGMLRSGLHRFMGYPVMATYHPAALLRTNALKRPVWEDMKKLREMLKEKDLPRREGNG
ncbi:uracil-DNA glycosylase [Candidatus Fermentibacteria bacterium]|nr:uracil-DNA glycosylase [Candidatus Fermentibacteria bacterium]